MNKKVIDLSKRLNSLFSIDNTITIDSSLKDEEALNQLFIKNPQIVSISQAASEANIASDKISDEKFDLMVSEDSYTKSNITRPSEQHIIYHLFEMFDVYDKMHLASPAIGHISDFVNTVLYDSMPIRSANDILDIYIKHTMDFNLYDYEKSYAVYRMLCEKNISPEEMLRNQNENKINVFERSVTPSGIIRPSPLEVLIKVFPLDTFKSKSGNLKGQKLKRFMNIMMYYDADIIESLGEFMYPFSRMTYQLKDKSSLTKIS